MSVDFVRFIYTPIQYEDFEGLAEDSRFALGEIDKQFQWLDELDKLIGEASEGVFQNYPGLQGRQRGIEEEVKQEADDSFNDHSASGRFGSVDGLNLLGDISLYVLEQSKVLTWMDQERIPRYYLNNGKVGIALKAVLLEECCPCLIEQSIRINRLITKLEGKTSEEEDHIVEYAKDKVNLVKNTACLLQEQHQKIRQIFFPQFVKTFNICEQRVKYIVSDAYQAEDFDDSSELCYVKHFLNKYEDCGLLSVDYQQKIQYFLEQIEKRDFLIVINKVRQVYEKLQVIDTYPDPDMWAFWQKSIIPFQKLVEGGSKGVWTMIDLVKYQQVSGEVIAIPRSPDPVNTPDVEQQKKVFRRRVEQLRNEISLLEHIERRLGKKPDGVVYWHKWYFLEKRICGEAIKFPVLVMKQYQSDLLELFRDLQRPDPKQHALLFLGAFKGLGALHQAGVVHRDMKWDNLLYDEDTKELVVADLDLAALIPQEGQPDLTELQMKNLGKWCGSTEFMAPEYWQTLIDTNHLMEPVSPDFRQRIAQVTKPTLDIFAMGLIGLFLNFGRLGEKMFLDEKSRVDGFSKFSETWQGINVSQVELHQAAKSYQESLLRLLDTIKEAEPCNAYEAVIQECLRKDPETRPTAVECQERLQEYLKKVI